MRVLLLEDDGYLCQAYASRLRSDGHAVDEARTLREARQALLDVAYDCLVLDRMVPDGDSLDLLAELSAGADPPSMICVSALGGGDDRVEALEAGADDYMPKPVRLDELTLRVRKVLVRHTGTTTGPVQLGRVTVNRARRDVRIDGTSVHVPPVGYSVLDYLVANRDRLVPTEELLDHCWDDNRTTFANPLHTQICRLRKAFRGVLRFELLRGEGYVLVVEPEQDATDQYVDL